MRHIVITPGHKIALARSHSNRTVRSAFKFYGPTPQSKPANIIDSKFIVTYRIVDSKFGRRNRLNGTKSP